MIREICAVALLLSISAGAAAQDKEPDAARIVQLREVQTALQKSGLYQGQIDGKWGPQTKRAVTAYQQRKNLPATGTLDQQTLTAMKIGSQ